MYITDALQMITENTTHYLVPGVDHAIDYGKSLRMRFSDLLDQLEGKEKQIAQAEPEPEDDRSSQEIASDIWQRIRGGPKQEQK